MITLLSKLNFVKIDEFIRNLGLSKLINLSNYQDLLKSFLNLVDTLRKYIFTKEGMTILGIISSTVYSAKTLLSKTPEVQKTENKDVIIDSNQTSAQQEENPSKILNFFRNVFNVILASRHIAVIQKLLEYGSSIATILTAAQMGIARIAFYAIYGVLGLASLAVEAWGMIREKQKQTKYDELQTTASITPDEIKEFLEKQQGDDAALKAIEVIKEEAKNNQSLSWLSNLLDNEKHPYLHKFIKYDFLPLVLNVTFTFVGMFTGTIGKNTGLVAIIMTTLSSTASTNEKATNSQERTAIYTIAQDKAPELAEKSASEFRESAIKGAVKEALITV
ncbi:MAG: hypothetical protein J0H68_00430 [Sphingobacteriia bacterium]|nr:hypothetical protein [Sphingobacteriia bacterium]